MTPGLITASLLTAIAFGLLIRILVPPPARLAGRVRPYVFGSNWRGARPAMPGGENLLQILLAPLARRLNRLVTGERSGAIKLKLRQSGEYGGFDAEQALFAYRLRQLSAATLALAGSIPVSIVLGLPFPRAAALVGLGLLVGISRSRGQVDRVIRSRQELMKIEIYTVNQLLAMWVRSGGGVVHAVSQVVARGKGQVVSELAEAMRMHRAGMRASDAFTRLATTTPEPSCARTYSLLAAAEERGADLARALLDLSEDVREGRREAMRRSATRKRAAMLIPIIGILAPVMLLFVGAPLPQVIFNWQ